MAVRNSEKRIPSNHSPSDLGQISFSTDGNSVLVAYLSSPITIQRANTYVVFVTDTTLASQISSYEWVFSENGTETQRTTTPTGTNTYVPQAVGTLALTVDLVGPGLSSSISLNQELIETNAMLETLISEANNQTGPTLANPLVACELVNEYNSYYRGVQPANPESGNAFFRLLFDQVYDGSLRNSEEQRHQTLVRISDILNSDVPDLGQQANVPLGVCGIRLILLGMVLFKGTTNSGTYIPWAELPEDSQDRIIILKRLRDQFNNLTLEEKLDLYNIVRFPKCNIRACGKILEVLRDRYFSGTSFSDVITGFNGVRLEALVRHFNKGPILRT